MKKVLVFITDGFSDWEASYVTAELNKPGTGFQVQTIAIDKDPKISMGGLTVLPDYSLQDFSFKLEFGMLIIPNSLPYLKEGAPNYRGDEKYIEEQSVSDGCLITANGSGALEFSRDILSKLDVLEGKELKEWYALFKTGFIKS